jgi:predicted Na+-dependent transporter
MLKSALILLALANGLLLPALANFTFVLRPFLMTLLFFSFLNVKLDRNVFAW